MELSLFKTKLTLSDSKPTYTLCDPLGFLSSQLKQQRNTHDDSHRRYRTTSVAVSPPLGDALISEIRASTVHWGVAPGGVVKRGTRRYDSFDHVRSQQYAREPRNETGGPRRSVHIARAFASSAAEDALVAGSRSRVRVNTVRGGVPRCTRRPRAPRCLPPGLISIHSRADVIDEMHPD